MVATIPLTEESRKAAENVNRRGVDALLNAHELAAEMDCWSGERAFLLGDLQAGDFTEHPEAVIRNGIAYAEVRLGELTRQAERLDRARRQPGYPGDGPPEAFTARFKAAKYVDLVDVAQTLTGQEAIKRGANAWIRCPFHGGGNERTPSLELLPSPRGWRCHACHAGGDAVTFVARLMHLSNVNALRFLETITDTYPECWEDAR